MYRSAGYGMAECRLDDRREAADVVALELLDAVGQGRRVLPELLDVRDGRVEVHGGEGRAQVLGRRGVADVRRVGRLDEVGRARVHLHLEAPARDEDVEVRGRPVVLEVLALDDVKERGRQVAPVVVECGGKRKGLRQWPTLWFLKKFKLQFQKDFQNF